MIFGQRKEWLPEMDGKWQRWPSWYDPSVLPQSAPHSCQTPPHSYQLRLKGQIGRYQKDATDDVYYHKKSQLRNIFKFKYTSENFVGVWGTQVQRQNTRNTGTMETLKLKKKSSLTYKFHWLHGDTSKIQVVIDNWLTNRNECLQHERPLDGICWDLQL